VRIPACGETVDIEDIDYSLVAEPKLLDHHQTLGQARPYKHEIAFEPMLLPATYLRTLVHEAIEIINENHELNLPHTSIRCLEIGLTGFLVKNQFCFAKECDCGRS